MCSCVDGWFFTRGGKKKSITGKEDETRGKEDTEDLSQWENDIKRVLGEHVIKSTNE